MIGLGIDTGGTYTDAVIYDMEKGEILASGKTLTSKGDLKVGIKNTLMELPEDLMRKCGMIALSTTLATNAAVEGRGGKGKLILLGASKSIFHQNYQKYGFDNVDDVYIADCGIKMNPAETREPDWDAFEADMRTFLADCECAAVCQLHAKRNNSQQERKAAEIIEKVGVPVIRSSELFQDPDMYQRGAGALLNARLIPVIYAFMGAIREVFAGYGMEDVPRVIVRSEGTLMTEEFALKRPVETLLCGPAASTLGAMALAKQTDAVIVDIGGTTTDVSIVRDGVPKRADDGIFIGDWKTFVKGLYVDTFGLGGDSGIHYDFAGKLVLEDHRIVPLSSVAVYFPYITEELKELAESGKKHTRFLHEYYFLIQDRTEAVDFYKLTPHEQRVVEVLSPGPMNMVRLAETLNVSLYDLGLDRLEKLGVVQRSGLTPTDIMHVKGDFNSFDSDAARYAAEFVAHSTDHESVEQMADEIYEMIVKKLYVNIARLMVTSSYREFANKKFDDQLNKMIEIAYDEARVAAGLFPKKGDNKPPYGFFRPAFKLDAPLIGVGAPTYIFLGMVAKLFGTTAIIPEYAHVANAVGAIVGKVSVTEEVELVPEDGEDGEQIFTVTNRTETRQFSDYEEAAAFAQESALKQAEAAAREQGASGGLSITEERERVEGTLRYGSFWIKELYRATATGNVRI